MNGDGGTTGPDGWAQGWMNTEFYFDSDASKVEVGYCYWQVFLKMTKFVLFGMKINSQTYSQFQKDTFFKQ